MLDIYQQEFQKKSRCEKVRNFCKRQQNLFLTCLFFLSLWIGMDIGFLHLWSDNPINYFGVLSHCFLTLFATLAIFLIKQSLLQRKATKFRYLKLYRSKKNPPQKLKVIHDTQSA